MRNWKKRGCYSDNEKSSSLQEFRVALKKQKQKRYCAYPGCTHYKRGTVLACCVACSAYMAEAFRTDVEYALRSILKTYGLPEPNQFIDDILELAEKQYVAYEARTGVSRY